MIICKNRVSNPLTIFYLIRRKNLDSFPNVRKLKETFGEDLTVAELTCTWCDSIVYYEQEQTLRFFNYFLNQILNTVGAKFKKRHYTVKYITEYLKNKKLSTFHVNMKNLTFFVPPHDRVTNLFEIHIDHLLMTKNLHRSYQPKEVVISTIDENKAHIFHETNVIEINKLTFNHKYGS